MIFEKKNSLKGQITVPGDKSISHRSIMFGSIANGTTEISGFVKSADCLSTIDCFRKMGIEIKENNCVIHVIGKGLHGLSSPASILNVGNSGTTLRLMSGILCAQSFPSQITGDSSIQQRPMKRIINPLTQMGGNIHSIAKNDCAPLAIMPSILHGISYYSQTASAQVKSSILLAGLYADSVTSVEEPKRSRNHSEIMLKAFGADIETKGLCVSIKPAENLNAQSIQVPGDISSAAYYIAAALITPDSEILIQNVGINPTRDGIIKVIQNMGGKISLLNQRTICGEMVADILVQSSSLHGITIEGDIIPTLIDELPVIAVVAAYASGTTIIKDAAELKVKECNRINAVTTNLKAMGADITSTDDGFIIHGGSALHGTDIATYSDHRIAMSFAVAALIADGITTISDFDCVSISYPDFYKDLSSLYN